MIMAKKTRGAICKTNYQFGVLNDTYVGRDIRTKWGSAYQHLYHTLSYIHIKSQFVVKMQKKNTMPTV